MAPKLSFVLVVHGEQAYVEECAESVLAQSFADIELIAIDDASPDHAPELLAAIAEKDSRVTIERLDARIGPGPAANLGLQLARGEYVWFIETTDLLSPGAVSSVVQRLEETAADVLVVDHKRANALGVERESRQAAAVRRASRRGAGPIEDHPELTRLATRAWDKVLRRDLLAAADARFGDGRDAAIGLTWGAYLAAERVAALGTPAYVRRRPVNAMPPVGSPLDAFDEYDALLARPGIARDRRDLLVAAMMRHGLSLVERAPHARRRETFARLAGSYRLATPAAPSELRLRLVHGDRYAAFNALRAARVPRRRLGRSRAAVRRRRRTMTARRRRESIDRHYKAELRRPIDPNLAVFAAYWYRGYSCNPRAIYEKARELIPDMRGVWIVKDDAVDSLPEGVEHVVEGSRDYYSTIARARYFVNNVNFPNHVVKREGTTHVMTHHGTPLKRMGLDQREALVGGRRLNFAALMRRASRWDFSISSNEYSTLIWERVYPLDYETLEVGYPRNDILATATDRDTQRIRAELGIEPGQTAVLCAPTHREWERSYDWPVDLSAVAAALGPEFVLLVRAHYYYDSDPVARRMLRTGLIRDVTAHPSVEELCVAADVLVTDYSSIMFDYGVLDRPIVIHAPDWDLYRTLRGVYFDLTAEPPGPVTRTQPELIAALKSGADDPEARAAFRARFCALDDGHAAERVVRRVWLGEQVPESRARVEVA